MDFPREDLSDLFHWNNISSSHGDYKNAYYPNRETDYVDRQLLAQLQTTGDAQSGEYYRLGELGVPHEPYKMYHTIPASTCVYQRDARSQWGNSTEDVSNNCNQYGDITAFRQQFVKYHPSGGERGQFHGFSSEGNVKIPNKKTGSPKAESNNKSRKGCNSRCNSTQRHCANVRERIRMRTINNAFDILRKVVPSMISPERRLSKIDTLRLAMDYISYLKGLIDRTSQGGDVLGSTKVILAAKNPGLTDDGDSPATINYSLSYQWEPAKNIVGKNRRKAKMWIPTPAFVRLTTQS